MGVETAVEEDKTVATVATVPVRVRVLVLGDAGVGKTRLCATLCARLSRATAVDDPVIRGERGASGGDVGVGWGGGAVPGTRPREPVSRRGDSGGMAEHRAMGWRVAAATCQWLLWILVLLVQRPMQGLSRGARAMRLRWQRRRRQRHRQQRQRRRQREQQRQTPSPGGHDGIAPLGAALETPWAAERGGSIIDGGAEVRARERRPGEASEVVRRSRSWSDGRSTDALESDTATDSESDLEHGNDAPDIRDRRARQHRGGDRVLRCGRSRGTRAGVASVSAALQPGRRHPLRVRPDLDGESCQHRAALVASVLGTGESPGLGRRLRVRSGHSPRTLSPVLAISRAAPPDGGESAWGEASTTADPSADGGARMPMGKFVGGFWRRASGVDMLEPWPHPMEAAAGGRCYRLWHRCCGRLCHIVGKQLQLIRQLVYEFFSFGTLDQIREQRLLTELRRSRRRHQPLSAVGDIDDVVDPDPHVPVLIYIGSKADLAGRSERRASARLAPPSHLALFAECSSETHSGLGTSRSCPPRAPTTRGAGNRQDRGGTSLRLCKLSHAVAVPSGDASHVPGSPSRSHPTTRRCRRGETRSPFAPCRVDRSARSGRVPSDRGWEAWSRFVSGGPGIGENDRGVATPNSFSRIGGGDPTSCMNVAKAFVERLEGERDPGGSGVGAPATASNGNELWHREFDCGVAFSDSIAPLQRYCTSSPERKPAPDVSPHNGPLLRAYRKMVRANGLEDDPAQEQAVQVMQASFQEIVAWEARGHTAADPTASGVRGVYLWSERPGTGKTALMDFFYETLPVPAKQRWHFHAFMLDIQRRLHQLRAAAAGRRPPTTITARDPGADRWWSHWWKQWARHLYHRRRLGVVSRRTASHRRGRRDGATAFVPLAYRARAGAGGHLEPPAGSALRQRSAARPVYTFHYTVAAGVSGASIALTDGLSGAGAVT
eukprot:ctg_810.g210